MTIGTGIDGLVQRAKGALVALAPARKLLLYLVVLGVGVALGYQLPNLGTPAIDLPAELRGEPGRLLRLTAEASGTVEWHVHTPGLDLAALDGRSAMLSAARPGRYDVLAWTARGSRPSAAAYCTVVIGDPGPTPPPVPPAPPVPPVPVPPDDPFYPTLRAAWEQISDPGRTSQRNLLASLYRQAAAETVRDPNLKTIGDLYAVLKRATAGLLPDTALASVRQAIAAELAAKLLTKADAPLDPATRETCAKQFARMALLLGALP